jgi:hypothetical protein
MGLALLIGMGYSRGRRQERDSTPGSLRESLFVSQGVGGKIVVTSWANCGRSIPVDGTALFNTIPKEDPLLLFRGGDTDYQRVVRLLDFKKRDVARASQISIQSVRYDHKIPRELEERVREWAVALSLVAQYFKDEHRTVLWFKTQNPLLGNITPRDMIRIGRFKKLYRFILNALGENEQPANP